MYQETVLLCRVLGLFLIFFVCYLICFMCPFHLCLVLDIPDHILYLFLVFVPVIDIPCIRISTFWIYRWLLLACPCSIFVTRNPNVDVRNVICPSIIFSVNAYGIKDCLKYWLPYPMIIHVITWMVSSSYISGCSACPLTTCLIYHSSL